MKTPLMDTDTARGGGHMEGEGTTNGGLTTEQTTGPEPLSAEGEDSADRATDRIESNTLGGTPGTDPLLGTANQPINR